MWNVATSSIVAELKIRKQKKHENRVKKNVTYTQRRNHTVTKNCRIVDGEK